MRQGRQAGRARPQEKSLLDPGMDPQTDGKPLKGCRLRHISFFKRCSRFLCPKKWGHKRVNLESYTVIQAGDGYRVAAVRMRRQKKDLRDPRWYNKRDLS